MDAARRTRALDKITALSARAQDLATLWRDCTGVIAEQVPYYWTPCFYTLDPASLLITSHYHEGLPEFPPEWLHDEYDAEDNVHRLADVVRSERGISTLHEVTGGDPTGTRRWRDNMELGGDQELIARLRTRTGETWGALGLYREVDQPMFDHDELEFVRRASGPLAEGIRRSLLIGEATDPEGPDAPGLLVMNGGAVESTTPGVDHWLDQLPDGDWARGRLPSAVHAVAARVARADPNVPGEVAVARVLSRSGTWVVLHGAALVSADSTRVAVIVEPAHPARIFPLLMSAYGLTERERDVTRLILEGCSTRQIAEELVVEQGTVQQHLKSVFDKTGVRSRRELVSRVFYTHYEPRFRDNEARVRADAPMRGGPALS